MAAILVLTIVVYWQIGGHGFVYDDTEYVSQNPNVQHGINAESIAWAFTAMHSANWHPLTWLSHALDWQMYGSKPAGHHATNLIFHTANTLLLAWVLYRMTRAVWKSLFVAGLFALHPLHVESAAWVAERKDVLSAFFWFLAMLAYVRYAEKPSFRRYSLVLLAFVLGLLSKPMTVSLPIALLILDYWPLGRFAPKSALSAWKPLILEKVPLFALSAASCVITVIAQQSRGAVMMMEDYPFGGRLANAVVAYAKYLAKMIWPSGLAAYYPYVKSLPAWEIAASAVFLAMISVLVVRLSNRFRYLGAGWVWYLVTLVPVIGLVQVGWQSMADRYTYIPLIGAFVMIAWGLPDLANRLLPSSVRRPTVGTAFALVGGAVILVLSWFTWKQVSYWKDTPTLWRRALAVTQRNEVANYNFGCYLQDQGKLDEAIAHFTEAVAINPRYVEAYNNLGNAYLQQGKLDHAVRTYSAALRIAPKYPRAHNNLGNALLQQGKVDEAIRSYREALRLDPNYAKAHNNLATALLRQGKTNEALDHYLRAVRISPSFAEAHGNLAAVYSDLGRYAEAWEEVRLCRNYGGTPAPSVIESLRRNMPEPR